MHTPPFLSPRRRSSLADAAFTLIELLVVISIIAVLAGLLLPVVSKVMENARKVSAKTTETQIVTAVNSYMTEYGQYPLTTAQPAATPTDLTVGTDNHNSTLFNTLRAINSTDTAPYNALNPRKVVYFEAGNVKNTKLPKSGFTTNTDGKSNNAAASTFNVGDLIDPWGNVYLVRADTGYSNAVLTPYSDATATADDTTLASTKPTDPSILRTGVIAYSYGLDGQIATKGATVAAPYTAIGDDVISWQ